MLACSRALRAHVLGVLACSMNLACLRTWGASKNGLLDELHKMTCLVCSIKLRASKNGVVVVL